MDVGVGWGKVFWVDGIGIVDVDCPGTDDGAGFHDQFYGPGIGVFEGVGVADGEFGKIKFRSGSEGSSEFGLESEFAVVELVAQRHGMDGGCLCGRSVFI